jgi:hypothetical protein
MLSTIRGWLSRSLRAHRARRLDVVHGPEKKPRYPEVLKERLLRYPPNRPVHRGPPDLLSDAEIEDNLRAFLEARTERLAAIFALFGEFGLDLKPLLEPDIDPVPLLQSFDRWLDDYLPARDDMPPSIPNGAPRRAYFASARDGDDIVFSFVADTALLIGETLRARWPKWRWALDLDPENGPPETMDHYRRIVLLKPADHRPVILYDLELHVLGSFYQRRSRASVGAASFHWWVKSFLESEAYYDP